jgi:hypothetical protein
LICRSRVITLYSFWLNYGKNLNEEVNASLVHLSQGQKVEGGLVAEKITKMVMSLTSVYNAESAVVDHSITGSLINMDHRTLHPTTLLSCYSTARSTQFRALIHIIIQMRYPKLSGLITRALLVEG